jgi:aminoacrylate peracid reductase
MPFEPIVAPGQPTPIAPYSLATRAGNAVYVSGVVAFGPDGSVLHPGDVAGQTRVVLEAIKATLAVAGGELADIAMNHIFLSDFDDYKAFNVAYAEYFPGSKPARYCVQSALVNSECLVEIASVAHF